MKHKKYTHITKVERKEIRHLLNKGYSQNYIAGVLERSKSSVSDEIRKNSIKGVYDPNKAHAKARNRRRKSKYQGMKIVHTPGLREYVEEKLNLKWSPEYISGRIKHLDTHIPYISAKSIYKYVCDSPYGGCRFIWCLARKGKKPKPKKSSTEKLQERTFIDDRPEIVEKKGRFGDWEGDFIVSGRYGKGSLLVLYERASCLVKIVKLKTRKIDEVHNGFESLLSGIAQKFTLTLDNDISFQKHKILAKIINMAIYFCHPYHSWEKGGVESVNGLIRRYIPKGSDISKITKWEIRKIEYALNHRPRRCLGYKTPYEVALENNLLKLTIKDVIQRSLHKKTACSA